MAWAAAARPLWVAGTSLVGSPRILDGSVVQSGSPTCKNFYGKPTMSIQSIIHVAF